jgi:hypothetical protein
MSCSIFERDSLCCDTAAAAAAAGRWPEDLPPGSVVVLSGKDDLMDSGAVRAMLERAGHVQVWLGRGGEGACSVPNIGCSEEVQPVSIASHPW